MFVLLCRWPTELMLCLVKKSVEVDEAASYAPVIELLRLPCRLWWWRIYCVVSMLQMQFVHDNYWHQHFVKINMSSLCFFFFSELDSDKNICLANESGHLGCDSLVYHLNYICVLRWCKFTGLSRFYVFHLLERCILGRLSQPVKCLSLCFSKNFWQDFQWTFYCSSSVNHKYFECFSFVQRETGESLEFFFCCDCPVKHSSMCNC